MSTSGKVLRGVVHGRMIELDHPLAMPDGCEIEVTIRRKEMDVEERRQRLQALFGSCATEADELDGFLDWNQKQRRQTRPEIDP